MGGVHVLVLLIGVVLGQLLGLSHGKLEVYAGNGSLHAGVRIACDGQGWRPEYRLPDPIRTDQCWTVYLVIVEEGSR